MKTQAKVQAKPQTQDKLAALRERLKKIDMGGNAGFWSPKEGKQTIRILPPVGDMEYFFTPVGRHNFPGGKYTFCPDFVTDGEYPCPICEIVAELYKGGQSERKLAGLLAKRRSFWMNIIVRDAKEGDHGPYIYTPGITVFQPIVNMLYDPDYGDITDLDSGYDITVDRQGRDLNTKYSIMPRPKPRSLSDDAEQLQKWMDEAKDLSWVELSNDPEEDATLSEGHAIHFLPYDRIVSDYGLESVSDMDPEEYAEGESSSRKSSKPVQKRRKPEQEEVDTEDVEEDDDVEDDEDSDGEEEVRKTIQRHRVARKSTRR